MSSSFKSFAVPRPDKLERTKSDTTFNSHGKQRQISTPTPYSSPAGGAQRTPSASPTNFSLNGKSSPAKPGSRTGSPSPLLFDPKGNNWNQLQKEKEQAALDAEVEVNEEKKLEKEMQKALRKYTNGEIGITLASQSTTAVDADEPLPTFSSKGMGG